MPHFGPGHGLAVQIKHSARKDLVTLDPEHVRGGFEVFEWRFDTAARVSLRPVPVDGERRMQRRDVDPSSLRIDLSCLPAAVGPGADEFASIRSRA